MKLGSPPRLRSRSLDDALLPLVNIVFLLMVFFLSSSHFGAARPVGSTPQSRNAQSGTAAANRVLELRADGRLAMQGEVFTEGQLAGRSVAWQGLPLDVRAAGDVSADRVLRLLAILRGAGVRDVRLLTVKGAG